MLKPVMPGLNLRPRYRIDQLLEVGISFFVFDIDVTLLNPS